MRKCPIFNNSNKIYHYYPEANIEGFRDTPDISDRKCESSPGDTERLDWYERVRALNLEQADDMYDQRLADYLNSYHRYLVLQSIAGSGGSNAATAKSALKKTETAYNTALKKMESITQGILKNNKDTQSLINDQTLDIENKTRAIRKKNILIDKQSNVIDEKNKILNSRERQIELGIGKNIYKRNIMYLLIFINVIVLIILFGVMRSW